MPPTGGSMPSTSARSRNVPSPLFIQLVGPVVVGIAHPRRDEHVLVAVIVEVAGGRPPGPERLEARRDGRLREFPVAEIAVQRVAEEQRVEILALPREHRDRKSTRLNSSHSQISYA